MLLKAKTFCIKGLGAKLFGTFSRKTKTVVKKNNFKYAIIDRVF